MEPWYPLKFTSMMIKKKTRPKVDIWKKNMLNFSYYYY